VPRTMVHFIDHKMFIAARRIQSFWRAYRDRKLGNQRWQCCITIQRWWRGFRLRRQLKDLVERRMQDACLDHFNRMATRIQAFFRGWYERRHIHDMVRLTQVQTAATEDLIYCLMQSMHHLKRTDYIPGFVSLQETVCTSKINHLMATMMFRFYNGRLTSMVSRKEARQAEARRRFHDCTFQTIIPYSGPDVDLCTYRSYTSFMNVGNDLLDPRMNDIANEYQASLRSEHLRDMYSHSGSQKRKGHGYLHIIKKRERKSKEEFFNTVMASMSRWGVWKQLNFGMQDISSGPEKQQRFLKTLNVLFEEFGINCDCVGRVFPGYHCP
ncbi:hypothetical protein KR032_005119, partial [Drosophila birchii]